MQTDWKIDMVMVDSMGDPLHNVMHSMGTNSVMGWNTVYYTRTAFSRTQVVKDPPTTRTTYDQKQKTISIFSHNIRGKG